jgi:hypothetical protein
MEPVEAPQKNCLMHETLWDALNSTDLALTQVRRLLTEIRPEYPPCDACAVSVFVLVDLRAEIFRQFDRIFDGERIEKQVLVAIANQGIRVSGWIKRGKVLLAQRLSGTVDEAERMEFYAELFEEFAATKSGAKEGLKEGAAKDLGAAELGNQLKKFSQALRNGRCVNRQAIHQTLTRSEEIIAAIHVKAMAAITATATGERAANLRD